MSAGTSVQHLVAITEGFLKLIGLEKISLNTTRLESKREAGKLCNEHESGLLITKKKVQFYKNDLSV
jgi:hypothetical protein